MSSVTHSPIKIFLDSSSPDAQKVSNSNYIFTINPPLLLHMDDTHKLALGIETCSIPLAFYTINENNNQFSIDGDLYTIPEGNYRETQLTPVLKSIISAVRTDITLIFDTIKSKYTLFRLSGSGAVTFNQVPNSARKILGFSNNTHTLPYIFNDILNLTYTSGVTIRFNNIGTNNIDTFSAGEGGTTVLRLPITTPVNTVLQHFNNTPFLATINNRAITQLNVSLHDDERRILSMNGEHQFFITVRVDYVKVEELMIDDTLINAFRKTQTNAPIRGGELLKEKIKNNIAI